MTFPAVRVFAVHLGAMRSAMAGFAVRNQFVLIFMTVDTAQGMVFGLVGGQSCCDPAMTAGTPVIRHLAAVLDDLRSVRLVTRQAGLVGHAGTVRLVTFQAIQPVAMGWMAGRTVEGSVTTRIVPKLSALLAMTGGADRRDLFLAPKIDDQRRVRIVTDHALCHRIMRVTISRMTHGTFGDDIDAPRRMLLMAVKAGHSTFVSLAPSFDKGHRFGVALDTVVGLQTCPQRPGNDRQGHDQAEREPIPSAHSTWLAFRRLRHRPVPLFQGLLPQRSRECGKPGRDD